MKTKLLLLTFFIYLGTEIQAQSNRNVTQQTREKQSSEKKEHSPLFKIFHSIEIDVKNDIRDAIFLEISFDELARINKEKPASLTLELPLSENSAATFFLQSGKVVSDDFSIITGNNEKVEYTPGLYYQGTIAGNTPSLAAWSFFEQSVMTVFSWNNENYVLGLWNHKSNVHNNIYILYKDSDVLFDRKFECLADNLEEKTNAKIAGTDNPELLFTNCVKVYFECDYQMYLDKGNSVTNVGNFVTALFNVVQTIYTNESIGIELSQIYVWTTTDPYISNTTSTDLLNSFQTYRTTFNGDLAHFLTTRNLGAGGLAYVDVLCTPSYAYGMSNIYNTQAAYPNYSWNTSTVAHELGHNFGSKHTHWCGWPGGAIDNCYATEGGCAPGPAPSNGGTIMSYCSNYSLSNGFGTLPGDVIRTQYNAASCLTSCTPTDPVCANVTVINACGSSNVQTYTGGGTGSWNTSTVSSCGFNAPGIEKIYSFIAPSTGTYSIQVTAASGYVDYQWKTSSCGSTGWTCIGNINAPGAFGAMAWTAGATYYILLDDEDGTTGTHTFYINCLPVTGPCSNIVAINSCGAGAAQTYTGGGSGIWSPATCGYPTPGIEQIYSFVAPTTGIYSIQVTAASGYVDYLWQTSNCSSSGWICIEDTNATGQYGAMSWTAGTTYYILLDDENSTVGTHTFYINCPVITGPCASAITISGCGAGAAQTYTGGGSGSWSPATCGYPTPGIEQIYSFVAPTTGIYSIQITAASGYVDYLWQAGTCSSTGWICIEDTNSTGQYGAMSWTAGTTYYILLDDENATVGTHTFYINCIGVPANPCTSAIAIGGCGLTHAKTYMGGGSGVWNTSTTNSCGFASPGTEQVYSFVAPTTGIYSIQSTAVNGKVNYQWKTSSCNAAGWSCISQINSIGQYGSMSWTAGITYYLLLDDEDATTGIHTFYINCPTDPSGITENPGASVNISPNPSTGNFTISIENFAPEKMQITICNVLGETVYISEPEFVKGKYTKEITLGNVAKGMYIVRINGGNRMYHNKIIVE